MVDSFGSQLGAVAKVIGPTRPQAASRRWRTAALTPLSPLTPVSAAGHTIRDRWTGLPRHGDVEGHAPGAALAGVVEGPDPDAVAVALCQHGRRLETRPRQEL